MFDYKTYQACVYTYTDRFYAFVPWLKLNGIKYELEETDLYGNGLIIKIYHGETKQQRILIDHYIRAIFPKIKDKILKQ